MADVLEMRLRPHEQAMVSRVGDETVILHLTTGIYFGLDLVATHIWEALKAGNSPREICQSIAEEFDVQPEMAKADARAFLEQLLEQELITET